MKGNLKGNFLKLEKVGTFPKHTEKLFCIKSDNNDKCI